MNATNRCLGWVIYVLMPLMVFAGSIGLAKAQGVEVTIPANAIAKTYGRGWECEKGFRRIDDNCAVVILPDNAYLTDATYGSGWKCSYGYKKNSDMCDQVALPANAYLSATTGDRWLCARGYRQVDDTCVEINVPANGYLTEGTRGPGWACGRAYRASNGACAAIVVPANGYLTFTPSGSGWDCDRGYREVNGACTAINAVNAKLILPNPSSCRAPAPGFLFCATNQGAQNSVGSANRRSTFSVILATSLS